MNGVSSPLLPDSAPVYVRIGSAHVKHISSACTFQEELALLHDSASDTKGRSRDHELRTAPIVTRDAYVAAGYRDTMTQYGVLGRVLHILYVDTAFSILP